MIGIPMRNQRERQTYCGAADLCGREFPIRAHDRADSIGTVAFPKYLQKQRKEAELLMIRDTAGYHRYSEMRKYPEEISKGPGEKDLKITCIFSEPDAPGQNPVEDIWLKGRNFLRKHFYGNKTSAQVKKCFSDFLSERLFDSDKLKRYVPQFI